MKEKFSNKVEAAVVEQLVAFQSFEDMILFLSGYMIALFTYDKKEKIMDGVFPETMFNKSFLKELSRKKSLEEMQDTLTEYCRQMLEKAVNKKSKKLYDHFMSYSIEERHQMIGMKKKRNSAMLPANNKGRLATVFGTIHYVKYGVYIPSINYSIRVYSPIDDFLNIISGIQFPKPVLKRIGRLVTKLSYQEVANTLMDSNIQITRQTVWNLTRDVIAPRIFDYEKEKTLDYLLGKTEPDKEKRKISTLFIEWDGVWISLENTKDESQKVGHKKEMKLGKAYIGWAQRYGTGENKSYRTDETRYVAGFEPPVVLRTMLQGKIDDVFDYAGVKQIIVGGDGANWIFHDYDEDARVILQLDMFHIKQKVHRCIKKEELKKEIVKLIDENKFLEVIEKLKKEIDDLCRTENVKKPKELLEYLENNFGALRRYQNVTVVKLQEDKDEENDKNPKLEARNLGTMEASVRQVISRRMKIAAWSLEGAKAMATMLCLEHEGRLEDVLDIVLDRYYKMKHQNLDLEKFIQEYIEKEDKEMMKRGQEANRQIIARGKYQSAILNVEINFKKILQENSGVARYIPKTLF